MSRYGVDYLTRLCKPPAELSSPILLRRSLIGLQLPAGNTLDTCPLRYVGSV